MAQHKLLGAVLIAIGALNLLSNIYEYSKTKNTNDILNGDLAWVLAMYGGYVLYKGV